MERTSVTSSNLESVGYDASSSILEVEFKDGGVYQYSGVPSNEYSALMNASSIGIYFGSNIKNNYTCTKIS